jgi:hypothetical protein
MRLYSSIAHPVPLAPDLDLPVRAHDSIHNARHCRSADMIVVLDQVVLLSDEAIKSILERCELLHASEWCVAEV